MKILVCSSVRGGGGGGLHFLEEDIFWRKARITQVGVNARTSPFIKGWGGGFHIRSGTPLLPFDLYETLLPKFATQ